MHLWDPGRLRYAWLVGTELNRVMDASHLRAASGPVSEFIAVQADCDDTEGIAEVTWLMEQADHLRACAASSPSPPLEQGAPECEVTSASCAAFPWW